MSSDGRVLLIGRGPTSHAALEGLSATFDVCGLVRDGDDDTTALAGELGVPVLGDVSVAAIAEAIEHTDPDAVVVSSYDRILGADLIGARPFVNVHYAPLPRGRGRATVNWAIINGDDTVAITIHHLVAELDAGGILVQAEIPITATSTATTLYESLNGLQRLHIADATRRAIAGDPGRPQHHDDATYLCARVPDDGEIDWHADTADIDRLVRALTPPFPGAFTWLGLERIWVEQAEPVVAPRRYEGRIPGRVATVDRRAGTVDVLTGDGLLRLVRVRRDEGSPQAAADVVRSSKETLGLRVADLVAALRQPRT